MRYVRLRNPPQEGFPSGARLLGPGTFLPRAGTVLLGALALASCLSPPPVGWTLEERWAMHSGHTVEVHNRSGGPIEVFVRRGGVESRLGQVSPDSLGTFFYRGPRVDGERGRGFRGGPGADLQARTLSGERVRLRPGRGVRGGRLRFIAERPRHVEGNRISLGAGKPPEGAGEPRGPRSRAGSALGLGRTSGRAQNQCSGWGVPALGLGAYQRAGVPRASTWMKGPRTAFAR